MPFYFAWVGGPPLAPVSLQTVGDVWGGTWTTLGNTWGGSLDTTADIFPPSVWNQKPKILSNLRSIAGLVAGRGYFIRGPGIPSMVGMEQVGPGPLDSGQFGYTVEFSYDGDHGGTMSTGVEPSEANSVTIYSAVDKSTGIAQYSDIVELLNPSGLTIGNTYRIAGSGILENTFFTYTGDPFVTISQPALTTALNVELTITLEDGRNTVSNLGDITGLVVGTTYQVFGKGIPASCLGTFQSDGTLLLSQAATTTTKQTPLYIHIGTIYPDGGGFVSDYIRNDEIVIGFKIEHSEGNFPLLTIDLKNPRVGLLSTGRSVWCWLSGSQTNADEVIPLFHGRLIAIPTDIQDEKITLQFKAEPTDYDNQQIILAQSLQDDPYYDPIWFNNGIVTPKEILEARTSSWHIDRLTLETSVSDITIGEDGTLTIDENEHVYREMSVRYGAPPLSAGYMEATVSWDQQASGTVDITDMLRSAFSAQGSGGLISSYSGDGLFSSWPKPETTIGGGWNVGRDSYIRNISALYGIPGLTTQWVTSYPGSLQPAPLASALADTPFGTFGATFPYSVFDVKFTVDYQASRQWQEKVTFFLEANVQPIATDSRSSVQNFTLSSDILNWPIDPDGSMPLRDYRDNSYFKSDRGQQSFRYLLSYVRARLVARARAVSVEVTTSFWKAASAGISCRWNATVNDGRLPSGTATGKITNYQLIVNQHEGMRARVTIGCTVGYGGSQTTTAGVGVYAADGYMAPGYQATEGGTVDIGDGSVTYENFDDFDVEDDGVNFFNMSPETVVTRLVVSGGVNQQKQAINATRSILPIQVGAPTSGITPTPIPNPVGALTNVYTTVTLQLVPLTGSSFLSEFAVNTSPLEIPKTIDLGSD